MRNPIIVAILFLPMTLGVAAAEAPAVGAAEAPVEEPVVDGSASRPAVEHEPGVEAHEGVDGIYSTFRRAYRTLDPELVGGLYTADAFYLQPNSDVMEGRESIQEGFKRFFAAVDEANGSLDITFRILDRQLMGDGVVDVGVFRIERDGGARVTRGKFVVVAVSTETGWRFRLDSFSPLRPAEAAGP